MIASRSPDALFAEPERHRLARFARGIVVLFVAAGVAWVLITDTLLYTFVRSEQLIARLETAKGWGFVFLAAAFLNAVARRSIERFTRDQAAMGAVVQSIGDGLLILGADRTIKHANPAALRMLACTTASDIVGVDADTFVRRYQVTRLDGSLVTPAQLVSQKVFAEGGPLSHTIILHPPGASAIVIAATAAAVRERPGDRPTLVVSVMHDISAQHSLEQLRSRLYAATAHSFKTPVAIIKSHAQLLSKTGGAPPAVTTAIVRQCDRIARLVHNVLVMSRVDSGSLTLQMSDIELDPFVRRVAREMRDASARHRVLVETDGAVRVHADQERLNIAISDLIDAAIRTSINDSEVTVVLRRGDGHAEIGIRHQPLAAADRMDSTYEEFDDIGVCRRVASALVAAHGGQLWEEAGDREATTWVRLPALQEQAA